MAVRRPTLALAAALVLGLLVGVQRAVAATMVGSVDPSAPPEAFACAVYACPSGKSVGFRQLALHGSEVEVDQPGVLVSARVNAKRITGGEQPRVAVLKPAGQVDLGMRPRRQPDGTVQWFIEPCAPCHMDGGTGRELLVEATVEPDADGDLLGDESQDPGLGLDDDQSDAPEQDELDDWFDELDGDEPAEQTSRRTRSLRLLDLDRARNGDLLVKVGTPGAGRLGGVVTTSAGRWDIGAPRTIGVGQRRAKRTAPVRLRLHLSRAGRRLERRPGRQRARIVVYHLSGDGIKITMRQIRL